MLVLSLYKKNNHLLIDNFYKLVTYKFFLTLFIPLFVNLGEVG